MATQKTTTRARERIVILVLSCCFTGQEAHGALRGIRFSLTCFHKETRLQQMERDEVRTRVNMCCDVVELLLSQANVIILTVLKGSVSKFNY